MISASSALALPAAALLLTAAATSPPWPSRASPSQPSDTAALAVNHSDASPSTFPAVRVRAGPGPLVRADPTTSRASSVDALVPRGRWSWPLDPRPAVARRFLRPSSPYGAGHRGVDLVATQGQAVVPVDAGTVTHLGVIAGRGTVSVLHASGLRSTYEPVVGVVRPGDVVGRGDRLGTVSGVAGHCAPRTCLHLGALRGEEYVDPLQLLGSRPVRLLPLR